MGVSRQFQWLVTNLLANSGIRVSHSCGITFFLAGSRAVSANAPCQQSMVNRVSMHRLFMSSNSTNITKAVWTFFTKLWSSSSRCRDVTAKISVRLLEGDQNVHTVTQPAKLGWVEVDLSAFFDSWLDSHRRLESLEIETSLICRQCTAKQLPYLKLMDLGLMGQTSRLQHKNLQPLLALHMYDPAVVSLLEHSVTSDGGQLAQRKRREPFPWFVRIQPCHRQLYKIPITEFPKYRNVVHPQMADIGKCVESCSFDVLTSTELSGRVIEHALFISYRNLHSDRTVEALCVPIKYKPIHFLVKVNGVYSSIIRNSLSVSECGCR